MNEKPISDINHIASAFDRDLGKIQADVMKMGGMVEQAIKNMSLAIERGDAALLQKIRDNDVEIDTIEEEINADVARVIALRGPIATDLRVLLGVMKLSSNLERIGDYARNIARRNKMLLDMAPVPGAVNGIRRMADEVERMLKDVLDAYIQSDVDLAKNVRARDTDIDQIYTALFREFISHMLADENQITPCLHLHFIAKNIERMGDHVTNVAEQVVYMYTGERLVDDRRADADQSD